MYNDFTTTPIFNNAALQFPAVGIQPLREIRLHITDSKVPTRGTKVNTIAVLPTFTPRTYNQPFVFDNSSRGGFVLGEGVSDLPKVVIQGWVDTSTIQDVTGAVVPNLRIKWGAYDFYVTNGELIAMYIEGKLNSSDQDRHGTQPNWYRDPFGRVYTNPRIIDYSGAFVEGVPARNQFTITMQV